MSGNIIIRFSEVSILQSKNLVLRKVSFEVRQGEFVYLIGRTGSGKSSLLKTMYAELPLAEGQADIVGFDLDAIKKKEIPFLRRKLGVVFQDFQLLTDRSITDNLLFVLRATGWTDKVAMEERLKEVLNMVGLGTKGFKFPHELSGGEQQRVVIARALLNHPELILADEPTGNLDPETSIEIMQLLYAINQQGTTILMATHDKYITDMFPHRTLKCENSTILDLATTSDLA
ncbi:MAG: ATP-binding cassette domain-containing protein [Flavobacteriales bacterium]|nr:ATP-binding cassette domain-containing protein [Flavobacteriales bacterium]MCZ2444096.1 ATP-binding cassette domain-containing protein [Flavobacteriales bacterium]